MKVLDRVFRIILAQTYRESGEENIEASRLRAVNKLMGYLVFPVVASVVLAMLLMQLLRDSGQRVIEKGPWQVLGILGFLFVYFALYRRYRVDPSSPQIAQTVSAEDVRYFWWFRCVSVGAFLAILVVILLTHLVSR